MAEVGVGASAYLESLKDENKAMEEQIQEMEAMATRSLTAQPTEALEKTLPQKRIKILSWNPPVLSEAGVDHGSEWRVHPRCGGQIPLCNPAPAVALHECPRTHAFCCTHHTVTSGPLRTGDRRRPPAGRRMAACLLARDHSAPSPPPAYSRRAGPREWSDWERRGGGGHMWKEAGANR